MGFLRYLICSMIKSCSSISKDSISLQAQYEIMKEKYFREKYLIATACFQLATQICVGDLFY
jgi:hypothetical protein